MTREMPTSKTATLWRANGRWFQTQSAAYYELAKRIVLKRYPRWLDDHDLEDVLVVAGGSDGETQGDFNASTEDPPIADWRARRDRRQRLFWRFRSNVWNEDDFEGFDVDKWQRFVRRLAKFLAFVDRRRLKTAEAA